MILPCIASHDCIFILYNYLSQTFVLFAVLKRPVEVGEVSPSAPKHVSCDSFIHFVQVPKRYMSGMDNFLGYNTH